MVEINSIRNKSWNRSFPSRLLGEIHERDQRMVEMPAMLLALYHHEQLLWKKLDTGEKSQIIHWFSQIFEYECADGNWQF